MRLLKINDTVVDIDENTSIGITFKSFDIKTPLNRFVNISNSFTIPATVSNLAIFGNASNPQSISTNVYDINYCDYWIDNEHVIVNSKIRVDEIGERISLFIFQKNSIWDDMKLLTWPQFLAEYLIWRQNNGEASFAFPFIGDKTTFFQQFTDATEHILLPMFFSNPYDYDYMDAGLYIENKNILVLKVELSAYGNMEGGHFAIYIKSIFQFLEYKYGVDFGTSTTFDGNIFDDPIVQGMYTPARELSFVYDEVGLDSVIYFRTYDNLSFKFYPLKDQRDKFDKNMNDFVNSVMQMFCVLKDESIINGVYTIKLRRFDNLKDLAPITNFSKNISGKPNYKSSVQNYSQNSAITFKSIFENGDKFYNSKTITCNNKNLDIQSELFSIDAFQPAFADITGGVVPDLSQSESFKTFIFLINDGYTDETISLKFRDINIIGTNISISTLYLQKSAIYSLNSEYLLLDEIMKYPKYYEIEKWLTLADMRNFEFFKLYWIQDLNGAFFINKISGFNPDKANVPTKLELIKISDKTPAFPYIDVIPNPYWIDGIGEYFVDGEQNKLY